MTEDRLSNLIDPTLRRMGIHGHVREAQLADVFAEVVGPAVASLCRVDSLRGTALVIATPHGALAHQLQMESADIVASINDRLGSVVVKRLAFRALDGRCP